MLGLAYKLKAEIDSPLGKSTEFALSAGNYTIWVQIVVKNVQFTENWMTIPK